MLSKISTSCRHGVTVQEKSELPTSVCSDSAGIFYKKLQNGKTNFFVCRISVF